MCQLTNFCNCIKDSIWNLFPFSLQSTLCASVLCMFFCLFFPQIRNYSDCACVQSRQVITPSGGNHELQVVIVKTYLNENGYALAGKCERTCGTLITFLIFLFIVTLITACAQPSAIIVTLRCVSPSLLSLSTDDRFSIENEIVFMFTVLCLHVGLWKSRRDHLLWECSLFFLELLVWQK